MDAKRPLGVAFIGYFYIFGAFVLIATLLTNAEVEFGIALRFGLSYIPENLMRVVVAIFTLIMAYGYLRLRKWGYWLMIAYTIYFLVVSVSLSQQYKEQLFYGNVIWSVIVLIYTLNKREYFGRIQVK